MAAGPVTVLDLALEKLGEGVINLESDDFNVVLCGDGQALSAAFTGTSGQALYSDLEDEVAGGGTGYTAGGAALANPDWSRPGGVATFSADSTQWDALTASMKYAVICRMDGATPDDILAIVDLEVTDPAGRTSAGGDFIINWGSALFTLTRA